MEFNSETKREKKRFRSTNFSTDEKHLIFTLVEKYKHVIENKKTDAVTCQDKNNTWKKIENEFNSRLPNSCRRNADSLKKFYYNKKKELRKTAAEERKERFLTGGGESKNIKKDESHDLLLSLMGDKTVYGLPNSFDCDNVASSIYETSSENNNVTNEEFNANMEVLENIINEAPIEFQADSDPSDNIIALADTIEPEHIVQKEDSPAQSSSNLKRRATVNFRKSRRRPTTVIKALTSSDISTKYTLLIDKRLAIAERDLTWGKEKALLEKESLLLDISIKKEQLRMLQNNTK